MKVIVKTKCKECGKVSKQTLPFNPEKTEYAKCMCPYCRTQYTAAIKLNIELIKNENNS